MTHEIFENALRLIESGEADVVYVMTPGVGTDQRCALVKYRERKVYRGSVSEIEPEPVRWFGSHFSDARYEMCSLAQSAVPIKDKKSVFLMPARVS